LVRLPAEHAEGEADLDAALADARHDGRELLGRVDEAQPRRALRRRQRLRLRRVAGDVDFRRAAAGCLERRVELAALDAVVRAIEVDALAAPQALADVQA